MKVSELIKELEAYMVICGDNDVFVTDNTNVVFPDYGKIEPIAHFNLRGMERKDGDAWVQFFNIEYKENEEVPEWKKNFVKWVDHPKLKKVEDDKV